jgi:hypothetical protein
LPQSASTGVAAGNTSNTVQQTLHFGRRRVAIYTSRNVVLRVFFLILRYDT